MVHIMRDLPRKTYGKNTLRIEKKNIGSMA
jgi:hypothetical protein